MDLAAVGMVALILTLTAVIAIGVHRMPR